ncbi:restriction endonuclease [Mesorhizobium sp. LMG 17147]|uniref:DpnI domain-containing protein n=1 Tax=Mesorhizobium sp. LMG 17147 TaxID=2963091 RepID=UPI0020C9F375|nr:DpnI domain-containing protein [Mesorhizobium sp. LMG 17147]MCP9232205.1 restriction endonuclease [Mesorhizobium sp. LMG 17147]
MKMGFQETQAAYDSGSQSARIWTERWASEWLYCPNCGNSRLTQFPANLPVADFYCDKCDDQYELKSAKKPFGRKLANGAYSRKIERLNSSTNPNFFLLKCDFNQRLVESVCVIPKQFFTPAIVERRTPLSQAARRAGWIGSNILLSRVPEAGRIHLVRNGVITSKEEVLAAWKRTVFLRDAPHDTRGWLVEVMRCIESIGTDEFDIDQAYAFEPQLALLYPNNQNIRPKIRQQLQFLRDKGYLRFLSRGRYQVAR